MQEEAAFWKGTTAVTAAYFAAFVAALVTTAVVPLDDTWTQALVADVMATLVIFGFSQFFRNASFYDAYWSVAPVLIVGFWALHPLPEGSVVRPALIMGCVALWGTRLTSNWVRGWWGLHHEDWRYRQLAAQTGLAYPLVNLLGIHLMPTLLVFLGLTPAWYALRSTATWGALDFLAAALCVSATVFQAASDNQLHAFRARRTDPNR